MTISEQQIRALTYIAIACRPDRAPTWDETGTAAAITRVRERTLPEVALAVIRAASDRDCINPGVIPSNGSHWQEQLKPPKWTPELLEPVERCSVCTKSAALCASTPRFADDDHTFTADFRIQAMTPDAIAETVQTLKQIKSQGAVE